MQMRLFFFAFISIDKYVYRPFNTRETTYNIMFVKNEEKSITIDIFIKNIIYSCQYDT